MNTEFIRILSSSQDDKRDLFLGTANRLGTTLQNVEKDFWVCLVLDVLFNGRQPGEPRVLFKGGTSLSKAYGLISRFSEDLDITVFREDIGQHIDIENMISLSGKQQRIRLNALKEACQEYIQGALKNRLNQQISGLLRQANIICKDDPVISDPDDSTNQTLLVNYPTVNREVDPYVRPAIKIEAGAKSALEPHQLVTIKPYLSENIFGGNLDISNIVTINAERTFWDKVIILHGLRRWHDNRGQLRQEGHRISRHYYDVYKLIHSSIGERAQNNRDLAFDCAQHAQLFFNSKDLDLTHAYPGTFTIMPTSEMIGPLKRDYKAMAGMIFGEAIDFSIILDSISKLEENINR